MTKPLTAPRREQVLAFVDESGQFRVSKGGSGETGVLAILLAPAAQHPDLAAIVQQLRSRIAPDRRGRRVVKGKTLDAPSYDLVADTIRAKWVIGCCHALLPPAEVEGHRRNLEMMLQAVESAKPRLQAANRVDLRLHRLKSQLRAALVGDAVYVSLLFKLYHDAARWFRGHGILPRVRATLDERLPRDHRELHDFVGRLAFYTQWPEVYGDRLGELLGVEPSADFVSYMSTDDVEPGLVIVDAIAYAAGMAARRQDPTGRFQAILDRMTDSGA